MITRKEYMENSSKLHNAYFEQFVTDAAIHTVKNRIGVERIKNSNDPHFNDIPLNEWDNLPLYISTDKLKEAGEFNSLGVKVCVAKQAARMIKEGRA